MKHWMNWPPVTSSSVGRFSWVGAVGANEGGAAAVEVKFRVLANHGPAVDDKTSGDGALPGRVQAVQTGHELLGEPGRRVCRRLPNDLTATGTEEHLRRLFDAAEDGGVVLLFDEADTLFGKRTEVNESHDRYANLEVGYLLQRMESFRDLAILTTNARSALDVAFQRRLQTIVSFPYPNRAAREKMWRKAFPAGVPLEGMDVTVLAALDLSGGGIAAAALVSSYLGAEESAVRLAHVKAATRWELGKSNRVDL